MFSRQRIRTSRLFMFLAIFWVIRGIDFLVIRLGEGYVWLKHGLPLSGPNTFGPFPFRDGIKLAALVIGVVILWQQYQYRKAQQATQTDVPQ